MSITFVTTTSHGSWLPGDMRGYVRKGEILPGDAKLLARSQKLLKREPISFSLNECDRLFEALLDACGEFQYRLSDVAVESWHMHWIVFHQNDPIEMMVGRLKTRMRQALARGRIWTEGYCAEPLFDDAAIKQVQMYIAGHNGCRMSDGRVFARQTPGGAGG